MWPVKVQIALALFILTCGPFLFWFRRDNLLAFLQVSTYLGTMLTPLFLAPIVEQLDRHYVGLYAQVVTIGAVSSLAAACLGFALGIRSPNKLPLTFTQQLGNGSPLRFLERRAVALGVVGSLSFVVAYVLLGYVPLFAQFRVYAKYGIGPYREGFLRGSVAYHFSLALAAAILPILLALYRTHRRRVYLMLAAILGVELLLTLSRHKTFIGPLVFLAAVAIERKQRPAVIVGIITSTFLAGAVFNSLLFPSLDTGASFASRVAASAPDIRDGIAFVEGFERAGAEETRGRTVFAGLSLRPGDWDPAVYSLRITTGITDTGELASGGIRLAAPLWGYSAFGLPGVVGYCVLSGLLLGWAVGKWKRLLTPVLSYPNAALNHTVSYAVFQGTFAVLGSFYFVSTGDVLLLLIAIAVGIYIRFGTSHRAPSVTGAPARASAGAH